LLQTFDLKRDDAQLLLETIATAKAPLGQPSGSRARHVLRAAEDYKRVNVRERSGAPVLVWESGDSVRFSELIRFLKVTGKFEAFARNAIGRLAASGKPLAGTPQVGINPDSPHSIDAAQALLDATRVQWG